LATVTPLTPSARHAAGERLARLPQQIDGGGTVKKEAANLATSATAAIKTLHLQGS